MRHWLLPRHERSLLLLLGLLALCLLVATCFYGFVIPQTPGRMERASVALVPRFPVWVWATSIPLPPPESWLVASMLLLVTGIAFAAYGSALYLGWNRSVSKRLLLTACVLGLLLSFVNVWSLPNLNTDIFNYIVRGRVAAVYGENPYGVPADQFPDDPVYPYASRRFTDEPGGKLPVWMALNISLAKIAGDNPVTNLLTYRLALYLFNAANLVLVVLIARQLHAPGVLAAAVLYAWNPIVILSAQSKTDTVMVFFMLLAAWALVRGRRWWLPVTLLVLSALVKVITAPLFAVYLVSRLKLKRWREFTGSALIGLLLAGATFLLLYFSDEGARQITTFLGLVEKGGSSAPSSLRVVLQLAFIVATLGMGLLQDGTDRRLFVGWAVVMLVFSLFITRVNLSWYLMTPLAIIAVVSDWRMALLAVVLSSTSFLLNLWDTTFTSAFPAPDVVDLPRFLLYLSLPAVAVFFVVARLVWTQIRRRDRGSRLRS